MIVQIYSLTHPEDVRHCVAAGVDHVGVVGGDQDLPAAVSNERARRLFEMASPATSVALSVHEDPDTIVSYAATVGADILHLCASDAALPPIDVARVRDRLPAAIELMRAIGVDDRSAIDRALAVADCCDWLLLDSVTPNVAGIGAAGTPHDWAVSAAIVDAVEIPVILAGGLTPNNVGAAIREVGPSGVDSYTGTSHTETRKDHGAVEAFVENARAASVGS